MDAGLIAINEELAQKMQAELGYAPNPHCDHCKGFGRVHPAGYDGKPDYSKVVMCRVKGCMYDSFHNRSLI